MNNYKLIDYFDVWGNQEDGWEVNNLCSLEEDYGFLTIADDATDKDIVDYLIQIGYLGDEAKGNIRIEGDDCIIELFGAENDMPLGRLEKVL